MKMKSILLVASLAAGAAFGQVVLTGRNECGVMRVDSDRENTIIAVPWMETSSDSPIKAENLVMADTLTEGDKLFVHSGRTWYAFELTTSNGVKVWNACTTVSGNGLPTTPGVNVNMALNVGIGIFLKRSDVTKPIYLYGQNPAGIAPVTVVPGVLKDPSYTLLASPKAEAFDLNASGKVTNAAVNSEDRIIIPLNTTGDMRIYALNGEGEWGYVKETVTTGWGGRTVKQRSWLAADPIPRGTGFWYVSRGGAPTFNW